MKNLLNIHKNFLLVLFFAIVIEFLFFIFLLSPLTKTHKSSKGRVERAAQKLYSSRWPSDLEQLKLLQEDYKKVLYGFEGQDGASSIATKNLKLLSTLYDNKISKYYGSRKDFYINVSRLDYQEEFNKLNRKLLEDQIISAANSLNLSEQSFSYFNYQLMLQLWTIEAVYQKFSQAELSLQNPLNEGSDEEIHQEKLHIGEIKAFYRNKKDEKPYLLEIPVNLTLYGNLKQIQNFCQKLQDKDTFLGLRNFSLTALPPTDLAVDDENLLQNGILRLEISCSGFYSYN